MAEPKYTANEIDAAYIIGVFNASGIDGLQRELNRMEELNLKPHQILDIVKQTPTV